MGNVGNIEKVMVFGILTIIVVILCIAIWGHNNVEDPAPAPGPAAAKSVPAPVLGREVPARPGAVRPLAASHAREEAPAGARREAAETAPVVRDVTRRPPPPPAEREKAAEAKAPVDPDRPVRYVHVVEPGDTFERIAVRYFGDRRWVAEIQKANEDVDPRRLQVGEKIVVPRIEGVPFVRTPAVWEGNAALASVASRPAPARNEVDTAKEPRTYVVQRGDTLSSISRRFYGTPGKWRRILEANRSVLSDPNQIRPGMELVIP